MINHILIDLDGVLSNFVEGCSRLFNYPNLEEVNRVFNLEATIGITTAQFWDKLTEAGEDFWLGLQPYPWLHDLTNLCEKFAPITISTSPSKDPNCFSAKIKWLYKYYKPCCRNFMLGPNKYLMAKPDFVLIDDYEENTGKFIEAGGKAIVFPQRYNSASQFIDNRLAYIEQQLEILANDYDQLRSGRSRNGKTNDPALLAAGSVK